MSNISITYKFSGHLDSNLFVRASSKSTVMALWSSQIVPIVNQHFPDSILHDIKGDRTWDECLRHLLKMGAVYLDQKRINHDFHVDATNVVRIHLLPRRFDVSAFDANRDIVFQNEDFLVVNKPPLLPVHPTLDNAIENLLSLLQHKWPSPIFSLHRLDLETTGLILFAKTEMASSYFHNLFEHRKISKFYKAVVSAGHLEVGHYRHWMLKNPRSPKKISSVEQFNFVPIELTVLGSENRNCLPGAMIVDIELLTGKTHQIRSQLAHIGFPLMGDSLYGGASFEIKNEHWRYDHFLLHAHKLQFVDPKGIQRTFQSEPDWLKGSYE